MSESKDNHEAEPRPRGNGESTEDSQPAADAKKPGSAERPATNVTPEKMARFVTSIKNPALQIGEHVLAALQHADTVAVLTTVVVGPGGQQHIVSAALDPQKASEVNSLLLNSADTREEEEPCIGFHCLIRPKKKMEQDE